MSDSRIPNDVLKLLQEMEDQTGRSKEFHLREALRRYAERMGVDTMKVNGIEDEELIIENLVKFSERDLSLLRKFAKGEVEALIGIVNELLFMGKKYGLTRNEIKKIVKYLQENAGED